MSQQVNDNPNRKKRKWVLMSALGCFAIICLILLCGAFFIFGGGVDGTLPNRTPIPTSSPTPMRPPLILKNPGMQPVDQVITTTNINQLNILGYCSMGLNYVAEFSPSQNKIVVGTGEGIFVQDLESPENSTFVVTGIRINGLAFSEDGNFMVTWQAYNKNIYLWRIADWTLVRTLQTSSGGGILNAALSHHGETIATITTHGVVDVWNASDGKLQGTFESFAEAAASDSHNTLDFALIKFAPNGQFLAVASGGNFRMGDTTSSVKSSGNAVELWDIRESRLFKKITTDPERIVGLSFSPDGLSLLLGTINNPDAVYAVRKWDMSSNTAQLIFQNANYKTIRQDYNNFVFSTDANMIAISTNDNSIRNDHIHFIRLSDGTETGNIPFPYEYSGSFSPDGTHFIINIPAYGGENIERQVYLTNVTDPDLEVFQSGFLGLHEYGSGSSGGSVTLSPTGNWALYPGNYFLHTSDCSIDRKDMEILDHRYMALSANDTLLAIGPGTGHISHEGVSLYGFPDGNLLGIIQETMDGNSFRALTVSPDGQILATAYKNQIYLWSVPDQRQLTTIDAHEENVQSGYSDEVKSLVFSPDGKLLASASTYHSIVLWNASNGDLIQRIETGVSSQIKELIFSPDSKSLASLDSQSDHVLLWNVADGTVRYDLGKIDVLYTPGQAYFSPDGSILAVINGNNIDLWNVSNGTLLHTLAINSTMQGVAFTPDGTELLSVLDNGTILFWGVFP